MNDTWASTYSPYLLRKPFLHDLSQNKSLYKRLSCTHINVEVCSNNNVVEYVIKYVNKGQDLATMGVVDGDVSAICVYRP